MTNSTCSDTDLNTPCVGPLKLAPVLNYGGLAGDALKAEQTPSFRQWVRAAVLQRHAIPASVDLPPTLVNPAVPFAPVPSTLLEETPPLPEGTRERIVTGLQQANPGTTIDLSAVPTLAWCVPDYVNCCWRSEAVFAILVDAKDWPVGTVDAAVAARIAAEANLGAGLSPGIAKALAELTIMLHCRTGP